MLTLDWAPRFRLGAVAPASFLAGLLALAVAAGPATTRTTTPATVQIENFAFAPATLTISAGTTVTWKNDDDSPHRIGDQNGAFRSGALDTDDTFSHTFAQPGEFPYICTLHPYMVGKIVVKPARASS